MRGLVAALGAVWIVGLPSVTQAQTRVLSRAEVEVTARTDSRGGAPHCALVFRLRNVGTTRLRVFGADIVATDMRTGAPLSIPMSTVPISGVQPGETKEWPNTGIEAVACDQVRLRVTSVTCMTRCESVVWTQQGLGALEGVQ